MYKTKDRRKTDRLLADRRRELRCVHEAMRDLFIRERHLSAEVRALERLEHLRCSGPNFIILSSEEFDAINEADCLPPEGTTLRAAAELLMIAGGPLHISELVRRLALMGKNVSKTSLTASLHRRAAARRGFERDTSRPNTFSFLPASAARGRSRGLARASRAERSK